MRQIEYNIDINKSSYNYKVCMQNDDLEIKVNVYNNSLAYDLTNSTINLNWVVPDGTPLTKNNLEKENNVVIIKLNNDFTEIKGKAKFELEIINDGKMTTFPLEIVIVQKSFQSEAVNNKIIEVLETIQMDEYIDEFLDGIKKKQTELSSQMDEIKKLNSKVNLGNYIHISFDDVNYCIKNLIDNTYITLFEEPFLAWLKGLHNKYGAKFSLYLYNISDLARVPTTYKQEFFNNSDWLKLGLHSNTSSSTYESSTPSSASTDWNTFVNQVVRFTGSTNIIDRVPRLNYFAGNKDCLVAMRDCDCGALGFLSADDSRSPYFIDDTRKTYLQTHNNIIDLETGLIFYHTDMRGDWFLPSFSSSNTYNIPIKNNVYDELVYRYSLPKYADTFKSFIYFCHEWQLYDGNTLNNYVKWTEDACKFAYDYNIDFDYPQNRIGFNLSSLYLEYNRVLDLIAQNSGGSSGTRLATPTGLSISSTTLKWNAVTNANRYYIYDSSSLLGETTTETYDLSSLTTDEAHTIYVQAIGDGVTYINSLKASIVYGSKLKTAIYTGSGYYNIWENNKEIILYTKATQMKFSKDYSICGWTSSELDSGSPKDSFGRATCIEGVLTDIFDGQTVSLSSYTLSTGASITYALYYSYLSNKKVTGTVAVDTSSVNTTALAWLSSSQVLPTDNSNTNTRILSIAFKKGDGSISFTEDELAELPTLIQIN